METKVLANALRSFYATFDATERLKQIFDFAPLELAADRLEELEVQNSLLRAEKKFQKTYAQQPEWISVEDERKPDDGETCIVMTSTDCIYNFKYSKDGFPTQRRIRYWMHKPALPKPKVPSFKEVFLKAFPKASTNDKGDPKACRALIFGEGRCHHDECSECWNQPYFEPQGEGESGE